MEKNIEKNPILFTFDHFTFNSQLVLQSRQWPYWSQKKLNDSYDIEISGTQRASGHMSVYVWDISNGENHIAKIVDRATGIKTISELKI